MNLSPFIIYLWQLCGDIKLFFCIGSVLFTIATFVGCVWWVNIQDTDKGQEELKCCLKWLNPSFWLFLTFTTLATFTPNSNTIAMMFVIPGIANSKMIQNDAPEIYDIAINALKGKIKEKLDAEKGK